MTGKTLSSILIISLTLAAGTAIARAQDAQDSSVADAARRARAEKKATPGTGKVFTNDDLGNLKGSVSVVGQTPDAPAAAVVAPADKDKAAVAGAKEKGADSEVKDEGYFRKAFDAARKKLADDTKEADILQREFNLKQQQYYSDPNQALREQNSRSDLDKTQAEIDTKKADIEKDTQSISDLTDELRKSGGDPGWANEAASQTAPAQ